MCQRLLEIADLRSGTSTPIAGGMSRARQFQGQGYLRYSRKSEEAVARYYFTPAGAAL
jgi:hypothetical protein